MQAETSSPSTGCTVPFSILIPGCRHRPCSTPNWVPATGLLMFGRGTWLRWVMCRTLIICRLGCLCGMLLIFMGCRSSRWAGTNPSVPTSAQPARAELCTPALDCMTFHGQVGLASVASLLQNFGSRILPHITEVTVDQQRDTPRCWKHQQCTWGLLPGLWAQR
jgi:hypothetical protein